MSRYNYKRKSIVYDLKYADEHIRRLCHFTIVGSDRSIIRDFNTDVLERINSNIEVSTKIEFIIFQVHKGDILVQDFDLLKNLQIISPQSMNEVDIYNKYIINTYTFLENLLAITHLQLKYFGIPFLFLPKISTFTNRIKSYRKRQGYRAIKQSQKIELTSNQVEAQTFQQTENIPTISDEDLSYLSDPLKKIDELLFLAKAIEDNDLRIIFKSKNIQTKDKKGSFDFNIENYNASLIKKIANDLFEKWIINNGIKPPSNAQDSFFYDTALNGTNITYTAYLYLLLIKKQKLNFTSVYLREIKKAIEINVYDSQQERIDYFLKSTAKILFEYINIYTVKEVEEKTKFHLIYLTFTLLGLLKHKKNFNVEEGYNEQKRLYIRDLVNK